MAHANCPECGFRFAKKRATQAFCEPAHKNAFYARAKVRGQVAVMALMAWRGAKGKKGDDTGRRAFSEVCRLADRFNAEDKAAGRPPAGNFFARQLRECIR